MPSLIENMGSALSARLRQTTLNWADRPGRSMAGMTLVELMIAMALVVLVLLLGMPSFSGMLASLRLRSVAEGMLGGIQMARTEAARRNQSVNFRLDAQDGGGWSVALADGSTLQSKSASEGGSVNVQSDLGTTLTFNNLGQRTVPAGGALTFSLTNPDAGDCQPSGPIRCLNITVQAAGQARLCDPRRTAPDPQAC